MRGERALLQCQVDDPGNPPAHSVVWTRGGVRVESSEGPPLLAESLGGLTARFRTGPADMSTAGQYACAASSELGTGPWSSLDLQVKCETASDSLVNFDLTRSTLQHQPSLCRNYRPLSAR